jgi:hypothetical protein
MNNRLEDAGGIAIAFPPGLQPVSIDEMGARRLENRTSSLSGARSSQLSNSDGPKAFDLNWLPDRTSRKKRTNAIA